MALRWRLGLSPRRCLGRAAHGLAVHSGAAQEGRTHGALGAQRATGEARQPQDLLGLLRLGGDGGRMGGCRGGGGRGGRKVGGGHDGQKLWLEVEVWQVTTNSNANSETQKKIKPTRTDRNRTMPHPNQLITQPLGSPLVALPAPGPGLPRSCREEPFPAGTAAAEPPAWPIAPGRPTGLKISCDGRFYDGY